MNIEIKDWTAYRPETFEFKGKWIKNWFSNMELVPITIAGITYPSVENYYQAQKVCADAVHVMHEIALMTPQEAKRFGRSIKLRPDWNEVKNGAMKLGILHKFMQEPWRSQLLRTGNETIIEWNNWGDKYWGVTIKDNLGANMLGTVLMEVRKDLQIIEVESSKLAEKIIVLFVNKDRPMD